MRPTPLLLMYSARLTLFTKSQCGLCDIAKSRLAEVQKRRTIEYTEVDIMTEENKKWYNMYAFDVPVLHVNRVQYTYSKPDIVTLEKKLMHRFEVEEVEEVIGEVEGRVKGGEGG